MELFATTAVVEKDGRLTVYDKTQGVQNVQRYLCSVFALKPEELRVMSAFVGGAFGVALRPQFQAVLAVLAARALERSVRVVLTRQQMYALGHRPAMIQRIAMGAKADGTLEAITHDAVTLTSQYENYFRQETGWSGLLYTAPMRNTPTGSRASICRHPATCAAPARPRRLCPGMRDGRAGRRAQDRSARAAPALLFRPRPAQRPGLQQQGARANATARGPRPSAGQKRNPEPRAMRDGSELVGWGMASGVWDAFQVPITVRIRLTANGHAEVASAASDIGTGTYTIMAQVAADMLGLPLDAISVKLGDSTLPQSPVEGGSWLRGLGLQRHRRHGRRHPAGAAAPGPADPELAAWPAPTPPMSRSPTAGW